VAVVPAERRKAAARSKRSTAESPVVGEAEEVGVRKSRGGGVGENGSGGGNPAA
jgi:hypothetical protein